jgi:hypothetical protein
MRPHPSMRPHTHPWGRSQPVLTDIHNVYRFFYLREDEVHVCVIGLGGISVHSRRMLIHCFPWLRYRAACDMA